MVKRGPHLMRLIGGHDNQRRWKRTTNLPQLHMYVGALKGYIDFCVHYIGLFDNVRATRGRHSPAGNGCNKKHVNKSYNITYTAYIMCVYIYIYTYCICMVAPSAVPSIKIVHVLILHL